MEIRVGRVDGIPAMKHYRSGEKLIKSLKIEESFVEPVRLWQAG
jgi:hypothetical protein